MQLTTFAYGLIALFASQVSATALTYKLVANEKACFYANNQEKGQKIAFYFAVRVSARDHPILSTETDLYSRSNLGVLSMLTSRLQVPRARLSQRARRSAKETLSLRATRLATTRSASTTR